MARSARLNLLALAVYGGVAFILLHPLIVYNGVKVAGFDFFNYNWNFWWIRHAFTTPGLNVYETNFVFYPMLNNFGYHALTAFWYPVWAVLEPLIGTLTAVNVIIFTACTLNGWLLYLWMRSEGVRPALALIGGLALQVLPISRYFYYNTHLNLMDWFWLPTFLLLWKQIMRSAETNRYPHAVAWAIVMGIAIWGLGLTDLQFPIFVGFVLIPYGLWTLWRSRARLLLIPLGSVAVVIGGGLLWFAGPLRYMARFTAQLAPGSVEDRPGIPFPSGFFSMNAEWWEWSKPSLGAFVTTALLVTLVVWMILSWRASRLRPSPKFRREYGSSSRTPAWFWLLVAMPPFLLSLGADVHIGDLTIPMPYRLMHAMTDGNFRMPWRLAPIYTLAAMTFCGLIWTRILPTMNTRRAEPRLLPTGAFVIFLLAISVRLFETAPLQDVPPHYAMIDAIGQERGDPYMILDVPVGVGTGEVLFGDPRAIQLQYYGVIHQRPTLNGFVSRAGIDPLWSIHMLDPMTAWLGQRRPLDAPSVRDQLSARINDYPIGYILIHSRLFEPNTPVLGEMLGFFNAQDDLLCPPVTERDLIVYRTRWHPDGCSPRTPPESEPGVYIIDIGADDNVYLGDGWHWRENIFDLTMRWAGETARADLYIDLPPGDYEVTFNAQAFWQARQLMLLVNDQALGEPVTVMPNVFQTFTFEVPAEFIGDERHITLSFAYDDVIIPAQIGQSADPRALSVMIDTVQFRIQSP